ncbi:MAG: YdcF family protein [Mycobacteriaceae bacterium]|uniref:YdcF family protein n=1 Tax=Corynebacterium sp. TaxID=1720 RepID=UPI003F98F9F2
MTTAFGVLTALLAVLTVWRIIKEPRRTLNGLLIVATLVSLWITLVSQGTDSALLFYGVIVVGILVIIAAGVFLLFNGVVVVRREGLRVSTLVPAVFGIALLGVIVGIVVAALAVGRGPGENHPWLGETLVFVVLPLCAVPVLMFLAQLVAFTIYSRLYQRIGRTTRADAVVVLGAGLNGEDVTPLLGARVDRGIEALRDLQDAGRDPVLVLSGGQGPDEVIPEAEAMARYAVTQGVDESLIIREDTSTTTEENLVNSRELLGPDARMLVVTSNYHAMRAASLTEQLGIEASVVGAKTASYFVPAGFLREFVAVVGHYRRQNLIVWSVISGLWLLLFGTLILVANL